MVKHLVIVESPTKAKTISRFLGNDFAVESSYGHIRDLPKSKLGVDVEKNFEPQYVIPTKARKTVTLLKKAVEEAERCILASVDYREPILIKYPDSIVRQVEVGAFIDEVIERGFDYSRFSVPAFDPVTGAVAYQRLKGVSRHPITEKLLRVKLEYGRTLTITASHSVFTMAGDGTVKTVTGRGIGTGDQLVVPLKLPEIDTHVKEIDLLKEIYHDSGLCQEVFIESPSVHAYRKAKVLAPRNGNSPQFQPRFIFTTSFREQLKHRRETLGWSQKTLAEKIDAPQSDICRWERDRGNPTTVVGTQYLNALGLNVDRALKTAELTLGPSSIEVAIRNAIEHQWRNSRKSRTRRWQPLSWFTWEEIEQNFTHDRTIRISRHNHSHCIPRFIPVNEDLMIFLGFFIAEGSYLTRGRYLRFSFGGATIGNEAKHAANIKTISQRLFHLRPSDLGERTSRSIVLNSTLVTFLVKKIFGVRRGAENKEVPWIVHNAPWKLKLAFLKGVFLGDGTLGSQGITFNTISSKLAAGIRFLLLERGILTTCSIARSKKPNRKPLYQIHVTSKDRLATLRSVWREHYLAPKLEAHLQRKNNNKRGWSLVSNPKGSIGLLKALSVEEVAPTSPYVYDFSVEGENFICGNGGVCAHNTDEDREGEAIAWHLVQALGLENSKFETRNSKQIQNSKSQIPKVERIVFHEITKRAIEEALENPREIDIKRVDAQQARRILDRLVGYSLSPFLWKKVLRGLSAGRVQSVAVRLVVEREREIKKFRPQEYWTIVAALLKTRNQKLEIRNFDAVLVKIGDVKLDKFSIKNEIEANKIAKDLEGASWRVANVEKRALAKKPLPPFTTSTLQQEAFRRLGFSAKQTMRIAQQLYEGVELGEEGATGLITYMRTDSLNLSEDSLREAAGFIRKDIGPNYALPSPRRFKTKTKGAQEAHEAIRPTDPARTPESIKQYLDRNQWRLYDLIWSRFIACQMAEAIFDSTMVEIEAYSGQRIADRTYLFRATGQVMKFDGFLKVWPIKTEDVILPELAKDEALNLEKLTPEQHFTEPLPRFTEASLIKALEQNGIGRPSTYAPTMATIQDRRYVEKDEQKRLKPTDIGLVVNDLLVEHFPEIVDIQFTAKMEEEFDEIAEGKLEWQKVIREFYDPFAKHLAEKYEVVEKQNMVEETDQVCEKCGKPMVIKYGRFGKFLACSGFPECKNAKPLPKEPPKSTGVQCPECKQGELVERWSRKRRLFYGCSRYPECNYATWTDPRKTNQEEHEK